jgi:pimeloyl-ACP methyl ester carboxylesterase
VLVTPADDGRIAATISQCPFTDGMAAGMRMPRKTTLRLWQRAFQDRRAARIGLPPVEVGIVGMPGEVAIMTAPDSLPGFEVLIRESSEMPSDYPRAIPARVMFDIPGYIPGKRAADITSPLFVCICEHDSVTPAKQTRKLVMRAPRGESRTYTAGHFDIYVGEASETVIQDQLAFLQRVVPVAPEPSVEVKDLTA